MDSSAVKAEISAQSDLLETIGINSDLVNEIDRHLKNTEMYLNERLVHVTAGYVIKNFVPQVKKNGFATKVSEEVWNNLYFGKNWYEQEAEHEEISFEKHGKGYGFFYTYGTVVFDLGVVECDGVDWYFKVIKDTREKFRVVGSSIEVKLNAFKNLRPLLQEISYKSNEIELMTGGF